MIRLRGGSGLGDSLYMYPIARHLVEACGVITVITDYPDIFQPLSVNILPHKQKHTANVVASYGAGGKERKGTSQFEDCLITAGVNKNIKLEMPWDVRNWELVNEVKREAGERPICIIAAPYEPFNRPDDFGVPMRINPNPMIRIVKEFKRKVYFIQIGAKQILHNIKGVQLDLIGKTSVTDLLDLVYSCDIGLSQIGNMLPMCEVFGKKNFIIFSAKGLHSKNKFIRGITPEKTVHYRNLNVSATDDADIKDVLEGFGAHLKAK